jgi:hypothetical protein
VSMPNDKKRPQHTAINLKCTRELYDSFFAAVKREQELHGFEKVPAAHKLRDLMREYIARVVSVDESANAKHAAGVLRRAVRS